MHDPFPIPAPKGLANIIKPYAESLGLQTLHLHFHEIACAFTIYHLTNVYLAPAISKRFLPRQYANFNARTRLNWNVHIVSFVQSTLVCIMALWVMFADEERAEMNWQGKIWGYTGASGLIQAFAGGYFVWDLMITLQNLSIFGPGMLAHAISALFVFSLGFRPFLNYYGPTFILYELSSPFLNIHWFCDKLNMTGSNLQLYNGIMLLLTFFGCRLMWGSYHSARVFLDVYRALTTDHLTLNDPGLGKQNNVSAIPGSLPDSEMMRFAGDRVVPIWLAGCYLASNITLNGLNWFWFGKMIETLRKRFDPPLGTRKAEKVKEEVKEPVLVEGTDVITGANTPAPLTPMPGTPESDGNADALDAALGKLASTTGTDAAYFSIDKKARSLKVEQQEIRSRIGEQRMGQAAPGA
ncbi:TLC domain-domain-containing protein [Clohesyomyces aquaticus]|uniref:TLC domain-domain-containing protein n=1 Tax=Clohesyomyces aquaticus TaxID=1231657 RepID=A0A1Y1ZSQ1_9PLEO|nr:TLC domain-domain-containing protein [Clohesyomyces aquaticus]